VTLPAGWAEVTLEELCASAPIVYGIIQAGPHVPDGVPYVRPTELIDGRIDVEHLLRTTSTIAAAYDRASLQEGDIVLAIVGTIGKLAIVPRALVGANITQSSARIRPPSWMDPRFLAHALRSDNLKEQYARYEFGNAVRRLNIAHVRALRIPLPPEREQRRIVAKLDDLLNQSNCTKVTLDAVLPLLEKFRQSILAAAFRGALTADWRTRNADIESAQSIIDRLRAERRGAWEQEEVRRAVARGRSPTSSKPKEAYEEPESVDATELPALPRGWRWAYAEDVVDPDADIVYGIVQPGPVVPNGVPYVRGMDIENGRILEGQLLRTHPDVAARYARASLKGGDVLLGIIRATKVAIVPPSLEGANITQGTVRIRPARGIETRFLAGWLDSPEAQRRLHAMYRGIDMPGLNVRDVRRLPVPIAPVAEQVEIGRLLDVMLTRVAALRETSTALDIHVDQLSRSLLAKAFRGELVPQDPNDEAADVMLARLRSSTPQTPTKTRAKRSNRRAESETRTE
jgi:type I restriction enzyme S subunit